jgi:hypothetical protein
MSTDTGRPADEARPDAHDEVLAVLPWFVNDSLDEAETARIDAHLRGCAGCRREYEFERRLHGSIRAEVSSVDHAPQASFEKLWSRIEEVERDVPRGPNPSPLPAATPGLIGVPTTTPPAATPDRIGVPTSSRVPKRPRRWLIAASLLVAFGAGVFAASPAYRTATRAGPVAPSMSAVRAVFDPSTTVEELTRILRESRLTIVAGPSESGVCTLALEPGGAGSVDDALLRLRADPRVRFAEPAPGVENPANR